MFNYKSFFNRKPVELITNQKWILSNMKINEDSSYVPRFSLNNLEIFKDIPVNKPVKPSKELLVKAIKYGMIFLINYKGAEDKHFSGHERVIYPMVLGRSSKGKFLLRGYHLNGWSVSNNKHVNKIWRMFRYDRIMSITFTGSFYRLAPEGYNKYDKGMRGGIIAAADFTEIRNNQQKLLDQQKIQDKEDVSLGKEDGSGFTTIKVTPTDTVLDLNNVLDNPIINDTDDIDNLRISFLKSLYGNDYIAILGAIGKPGNKVKVKEDKGSQVGVYKVLDSVDGKALKKIKKVKGNNLYTVYIFDKKI